MPYWEITSWNSNNENCLINNNKVTHENYIKTNQIVKTTQLKKYQMTIHKPLNALLIT